MVLAEAAGRRQLLLPRGLPEPPLASAFAHLKVTRVLCKCRRACLCEFRSWLHMRCEELVGAAHVVWLTTEWDRSTIRTNHLLNNGQPPVLT